MNNITTFHAFLIDLNIVINKYLKMSVTEGTKQCTKCKIVKPLDEFNRSKVAKDQLTYYCKECIADYSER